MAIRPFDRGVVIVGGALDAATVERNAIVSAAAAKWQLDFARAIGLVWEVRVTCLSYLPVCDQAETSPIRMEEAGITIIPIVRHWGIRGACAYAGRMLWTAWRFRGSTSTVFCYNPLIWTAPWAFALALISRAPLVLIVADLEPDEGYGRRYFRRTVERGLLRLASRYLILSPAMNRLLPGAHKAIVFNGLADQTALNAAPPQYGGTLRFVYAGSISREAGVYVFIAAAETLAAEGYDCEFHIFGRGSLDVALSDGLEARLHIHGFVDEEALNSFLGSDCIGVNPRPPNGALDEFTAPYKLLYYLSRGVATITTITGGVPSDLAEVCILAADGADGLADAMRSTVAMTHDERSRWATEGRDRVRTTRSATALALLLADLLEGHRDAR